jgi:lipoprotein-anchoring transpeptidase ErfK/SrfK
MKKMMKNSIFGVLSLCAFLFLGISFAYAVDILDTDVDGLSDRDEIQKYGTNPNLVDTDADGFSDGKEIEGGYSPHFGGGVRLSSIDTDADGLFDDLEMAFGTSLVVTDTDHDAYTDFDEISYGYSPTSSSLLERLDRSIVVDKTTQQLWFNVAGHSIKQFPVSTGNPRTPTPSGEFSVQVKREYVDYIGVDYRFPHIRWNLQFLPHYYIHTATWHNDFGKRTRSHGCVNMREADAGFLFKYLDVGVPVTVTGTTPSHFYVVK